MKSIKSIVRRVAYGYKAESETYIEYLKSKGVYVGEGVRIFMPRDTVIDVQNPYLLSIGNHVSMTGPITIMTHDYSWEVFKNIDGRIVGNQRPVIIKDNVFIGWGATILAGSIIEENVIIGAGSVVATRCEKNSVYAGNPVRRLMSIEELIDKRMNRQVDEAKGLAEMYYKRFRKKPPMEIFDSYFPIFTASDNEEYLNIFKKRLSLEGNEETSYRYMKDVNKNVYGSFEEFLHDCKFED